MRGARASSITSGKINKWRRRTQFFAIVGFIVEELHSVEAAVTDRPLGKLEYFTLQEDFDLKQKWAILVDLKLVADLISFPYWSSNKLEINYRLKRRLFSRLASLLKIFCSVI